MGSVGMMDSLLLYKILQNRTGAEISASGNPAIMSDTLKNNPMNEMKVFGWSKQESTTGAQLFPTITPSTEVKSGITVEYMEHGKIHISGTAEKTVDFMTPTFKLLAGTYTLSMGVNIDNALIRCTLSTIEGLPFFDILNNGASKTETTTDNMELYLLLRVYSGKTIDLTVRPMLNAGTSPLPWEPYTGGQPSPSPDYPQNIISAGMKWSTGKNLCSVNKLENIDWAMSDKDIVDSLNALSVGSYVLSCTYTLIAQKDNCNISKTDMYGVYIISKDRTIASNKEMWLTGLIGASKQCQIPIEIKEPDVGKISVIYFYGCGNDTSGGTGITTVSKIQIEKGTEATAYEPYTNGVPKLYGDNISVEVHGKNLVNIPDSDFTGIKLVPITLKKGTYWFMADIKPNTSNKGSIMFRKNEEEKAFFDLEQKNGSLKEITLTEDVDEIIMYSGMGYVDSIDKEGVYKNIMISADKPTTYEPYHEQQSLSISTPTGLPAIPVDTGGNYTDADGQQWISDYVDLKRGKYVQNVGTMDLNDMQWRKDDNYISSATVLQNFKGENNRVILPFARWAYNYGGDCFFLDNNGTLYFGAEFSKRFETLEQFQAYLQEHDSNLYYQFVEPIERDLTASEIQAYKNLVTCAGTTIVENDAECYMEVSAGGGDSLRAKKLALILGE